MRITSRTYPQPDSPMPQIGPRERALAVLKYVGKQEPEASRLEHVAPRFARLTALYEERSRTAAERAVEAVNLAQALAEVVGDPAAHPLFACVVHSFEQADRSARGEPLPPSLIEMLRS